MGCFFREVMTNLVSVHPLGRYQGVQDARHRFVFGARTGSLLAADADPGSG